MTDRRTVRTAKPSLVLLRLASASVFLLVSGLALARPDVVALAIPFTISLVLVVARGRSARVSAELTISRAEVVEGSPVHGQVVLRSTVDLDAVLVEVGLGPGLVLVDGGSSQLVAVRANDEVVVDLGIVAAHWGRSWVGPVRVRLATAGLAFEVTVPDQPRSRLVVLPATETFRSDASLPYAVTSAGTHRSAMRGDGLDFAGIRPFTYGDRVRRVNWRVTRRTGTLHVVEANTERASEIVVLVDSAQDVGRSEGIGGRSSSLDGAVRAAASVMAHYLGRGDSVRLVDVGTRLRFLRRLTGRRDATIGSDWLLDTRLPEVGAAWAPDLVARLVPPRSLVLALTPLLDERMTTLVARLRQRGQPVVVVDTLPPDALPGRLDPYEALGLRTWMLERERTVALLLESGCPVVAWTSAGALDRALRSTAALTSAPRPVSR